MLHLIIALAAMAQVGAQETTAPRICVPAYFYPAGDGLKQWQRLLDSPGQKSMVIVVNPASGPGEKADPNYEKIIDQAKKTGVTLIGYVTTSYAKKPVAEVKEQVDRWLRLYPGIKGIFFDEQASGADKVDYYAQLYEHVRKTRRLGLVVSNPGTVCAEEYLSRPTCDACCLFEGKAKDKIALPAWVDRHVGRVCVLPYKVADADMMRNHLHEIVERKFGFAYITDRGGVNPWDGLPSYWESEVAAVSKARAKGTQR